MLRSKWITHAWTVASGQQEGNRIGQPLQPVADNDADVFHAAVLDLGEHPEPELGALAAVTGPQPQDVPFAVAGHPDRHVGGTVSDPPVADLHHDRVDKDHRVHPVQRSAAPVGHLLQYLVGDPGDSVLRNRGALDVGEMRRDLAGGKASCRQQEDDLVDAGQPAVPLLHDRRLERAVVIPGNLNLNLHRPDLE